MSFWEFPRNRKDILNHLFGHGVVLVTTSNTEIKNLYKDGLQRNRFLPAIALLEKHTMPIQVDSGSDYRMAYLRNDAIFHTPLGVRSDKELTKCFKHLAGRYLEGVKAISIYGRDINVVAAGPGVVWFEFQSLCQTNRSNADYIDIAKQYHTVLLANIPQLDKKLHDATRRFIELVDEFYDRNVNLIVSSAKTPENMYTGKRLSEPFQRTSRRLTEMSSGGYLSRPHLN